MHGTSVPTRIGQFYDTENIVIRDAETPDIGMNMFLVFMRKNKSGSYNPSISELELLEKGYVILTRDYLYIRNYWNRHKRMPVFEDYYIEGNTDGTSGGYVEFQWK